MELFLIFTGAFIVALSGALMPGPLLTVTVAHSMRRGFPAGPLVVLGHMLLELTLIILILLGLKNFLLIPSVITVVFLAGGSILIYMGIDLLRKGDQFTLEPRSRDLSFLTYNPVVSGIVVSLANPYWFIWWITIGLGYLIKALEYKILGISLFFGGHILADLAWYSFISYTFSRTKNILSTKNYHKIIFGCGVFLILFGLWFLYGGLEKIFA
ncbi:MAG: LysE family transporter [Elusimicrobiota bacterium]